MLGHLQVAVNAPEAKVFVGGVAVGEASPRRALNLQDLVTGEVEVRVTAKDYEEVTQQATIKRGEWTQLVVELPRRVMVAGERRTFNGIEFVWIPPGTFMMGSPSDEEGRQEDETQHRVTISRGFWLGRYEVTQAQWKRVMGSNPSKFVGDDMPVETVSWNDCNAFMQGINGSGDAPYRLPTEAEWEYACRGGTSTPFGIGSGTSLSSNDANFDGKHPYGGAQKGVYLEKTTPVGSYSSNSWGLHDMHGNVWEWCADRYSPYAGASATDPAGPSTGKRRVLRGGSWFNSANYCRAANRDGLTPDVRISSLGFRVLRTP